MLVMVMPPSSMAQCSKISKGITWRTPTEEFSILRCLIQAASIHTEVMSEKRVLGEACYENPIINELP